MVPFREAYPMIIFLVLDVLAGNTAFVSPWHPLFAKSHPMACSLSCEYRQSPSSRMQVLTEPHVVSLRFLMWVLTVEPHQSAIEHSIQLGSDEVVELVQSQLTHRRGATLSPRSSTQVLHLSLPR